AHRGRIEAARQDFDAALRLRSGLVDFAAWYDVELAVVLARAAVRLSELSRAHELLVEATRTLRQLRDAHVLAAWLEESWRHLARAAEGAPGAGARYRGRRRARGRRDRPRLRARRRRRAHQRHAGDLRHGRARAGAAAARAPAGGDGAGRGRRAHDLRPDRA